jgi:phosphoribosylformylglycinamidine (FGAM) synthase PurS component
MRHAQVFWVRGDDSGAAVLHDPVLQRMVVEPRIIGDAALATPDWVIDVRWRPGVTDNRGQAAAEAMGLMSETRSRPESVASGETYHVWCGDTESGSAPANARESLMSWARQSLANPLVQDVFIQDWSGHERRQWTGRVAKRKKS